VSEPGTSAAGGADTTSLISGCCVGLTAVGTLFEKDKDPKEVNTTEMEKDPLAVLLELSRTLEVKMKLPGVVGVPQSTPAGDKLKPGGNVPGVKDQI
jgi:hypothetical protein